MKWPPPAVSLHSKRRVAQARSDEGISGLYLRLCPFIQFRARCSGVHAFQGEEEGGALVKLRLRPYLTAVLADDALHRGQAHAGAFKLNGSVQSLEDPEELVHILHVEADAVVAHEDRRTS